jgi:hypothetical protein
VSDPNSATPEKVDPTEPLEDIKEEGDRGALRNAKTAPPRSKPRRVLPPLKRDDEFVDLQHVIDKSAPIYEFTHGYMDAIILKCDKCKRHARGTFLRTISLFSIFSLLTQTRSALTAVEWNLTGFEIKPGPGDRGYSFRCSECNMGKQHFEHTEKTWFVSSSFLRNLQFCHCILSVCRKIISNSLTKPFVCVGSSYCRLDITLTCLYNLELADRDKGGNRFFHVR